MRLYGPYFGTVDTVHDGDTIDITLDVGFDLTVYMRCRVFGINAPELSTQEGKDARDFAKTLLPIGSQVFVVSHNWDKFGGRTDGTIQLSDGRDFGTIMLETGHAVPFSGKVEE